MPFIVGLLEPFLNDLSEYLEMMEAVVIIHLDRDSFHISHKSPECKFTIKSGFDDDGYFLSLSLSLSPPTTHPPRCFL